MDDRYVFDFFNWTFACKLMAQDKRLIPIFLPCSLLLQVFYNPHLNRSQRYHFLCIGSALVFIQLAAISLKNTKKPKGICFATSRQVLIKYFHLAVCLSPLFRDSKPFNLASCTSHLLEHFFGLVRRFCERDDSVEKFEWAMVKGICIKSWAHKLNLKNRIPGRKGQDSAAIVEEGELSPELCEIPFEVYVYSAYNFYKNLFEEFKQDHFDNIFPELSKVLVKPECSLISFDPETFGIEDFSREKNTCRQNLQVSSRSVAAYKRIIEGSEFLE